MPWRAAHRASFEVVRSELAGAHYEVSLSDPSGEWSNQAVVTEGPSGKGKKAHSATFSADVAGPSGQDHKLRYMVEDLVGLGDPAAELRRRRPDCAARPGSRRRGTGTGR